MSEKRGRNKPIKEYEHTIVPISFCHSGLPRGIPTQHSALYTVEKTHLGRMLQFDERHHKIWFREHRFSVLMAWLSLQEC